MAPEIRERRIQDFAESQGWSAAIVDSGFGTRAVFNRLKSGADGWKGSGVIPSESHVEAKRTAAQKP
jgi:hypothetical protein